MPFLKNAHIGITPTGWTNDDLPTVGEHISFEQCVGEIALAGYEGCSIGHKYPTSAATLKKELALRNLRISEPWASTYFVVELNRKPEMKFEDTQTVASFEERVKFIKEVEADPPTSTLPHFSVAGKADMVIAELSYAVHQLPLEPLSTRPHFTDAEWKILVAGLQVLATRAEARNIKLCYHHHVGTGIQQADEIDRLMNATKNFPKAFSLLLDTGHLYYAEELTKPGSGQTKLDEIVEKYARHIQHVHLKNIRQDILEQAKAGKWSFLQAMQAGVFTVPGDPQGIVKFDNVFKQLAQENYAGWLIVEAEQDPRRPGTASPLEYAQMAHKFVMNKVEEYSRSLVTGVR
jgi:inosose dehydratase